MDFEAALHYLAALAGFEVSIRGERVEFLPVDATTPVGHVNINLFRVPFVSFAAVEESGGRMTPDFLANLRMLGFADLDRSRFFPYDGGIYLRDATALERLRLQTLSDSLQARTQLKASVRLLHSAEPLPLQSPVLSPDELAEWRREISGIPFELLPLPSVTLGDDGLASIHAYRDGVPTWTGTKIDFEAERLGLGIVIQENLMLRDDFDPATHLQANTRAILGNGDTHVSILGERDGRLTYRVLTLELIDPTGQTIANRDPDDPERRRQLPLLESSPPE